MADEAAAKLLDLSQPIDVPLLDATVAAFYGAGSNEEVTDGAFATCTQCIMLYDTALLYRTSIHQWAHVPSARLHAALACVVTLLSRSGHAVGRAQSSSMR